VQVVGSIPWRAAASGTEGRSKAEVCTSEARKMRVPLVRARDGVPQEGLVSLPGAERGKTLGLLQLLGREGVAGGNISLEGVPEDGCSYRLEAGGDFPQQTKELPGKALFV
jgi:hypothetical protein